MTDKVWHELAFGLESLGADQQTIRRRVAEMADFFGIEGWFHREVNTLSGGQKQLLNLASIMAMQPEALLLDEPTGQLDPIAAGEFLAALGKINRELGVTVIISEHRLEEVFPYSDRAVVLDQGQKMCIRDRIMDMAAYTRYNPLADNKSSEAAKQQYINDAIATVASDNPSAQTLAKAIIILKSLGYNAADLTTEEGNIVDATRLLRLSLIHI